MYFNLRPYFIRTTKIHGEARAYKLFFNYSSLNEGVMKKVVATSIKSSHAGLYIFSVKR